MRDVMSLFTRTLRKYRGAILVGVGLVAVAALSIWLLKPEPAWIQGQIEVTRVRIAAKVPGRVESILVHEGESVAAGQRVAVLAIPEIGAKARQADALVESAEAQADKARAGARNEFMQLSNSPGAGGGVGLGACAWPMDAMRAVQRAASRCWA